jgi:glycosyltransferase involved in cell wall biosynthesis
VAIESDVSFCLLGENNHTPPPEFTTFKDDYPQSITAYGYLESRQAYLKQLSQNRLLPVTSYHDFLGLSVLEAMAFGVIPLLPNRLVYPELIPPELHAELLYDNEAQLLKRSLILLKDGLQEIEIKLIENHLQQYHQTQTAASWAKLFQLLE